MARLAFDSQVLLPDSCSASPDCAASSRRSMGNHGWGDYEMEGQHHEWSLQGERDALSRFDIGLMPLPLEDWAKGKSGGKARTYMAAGVVPVVSAIGYNLELIVDDETGFLCRTGEEWERAIERLIADPALRARLASAARENVERRFSQAGQASKLASLIRQVVDDKRHGT
jgi:glycosyltransferase involved in cell wall biosynthesis